MLMQRLTRLQEDSEAAKRIALELEAECRVRPSPPTVLPPYTLCMAFFKARM